MFVRLSELFCFAFTTVTEVKLLTKSPGSDPGVPGEVNGLNLSQSQFLMMQPTVMT